MPSVAETVFSLVKNTVESLDLELYDVRFVKEGASHYLRIFIDKPGGADINDCTAVSHAVDPIIDEADPIDGSYYLEVCSAGLERELTRPEHFKKFAGSRVKIKLYKALNGSKELSAILQSRDESSGGITVNFNNNEIYFEKKEVSSVKLDDMNIGGTLENE